MMRQEVVVKKMAFRATFFDLIGATSLIPV
jgi:hypothetical protein